MFSHKPVEKVLPGEQRMLAIGNHQRRRDLHRIGVKFGTLMAKQRQNGRYAKLQQGEKVIYSSGTFPVVPERFRCV